MHCKKGMIVPSQQNTLYILHILTYYDLLRILLFLEIWIVIKEVDVGDIYYIYLYEQTSDTNENNKTCKAGRVTPKYCL